MTKVLLIGSGGREHATAWKLLQSPDLEELHFAPGIDAVRDKRVRIYPECGTFDSWLGLAQRVDFTVVGPEAPLSAGLVDLLESEGHPVVGPCRKAARLEGSKVETKLLLDYLGVPIPTYAVFDSPDLAEAYVKTRPYPVVVKADGLAQGKGSIVCTSTEEALAAVNLIMRQRRFGDAGERVVIERRLYGREASFFCFTDGETVLPLDWVRDYKPAFDNDDGLNTGGMGGYSPHNVIDQSVILRRIVEPIFTCLRSQGILYRGILYVGLMIDSGVPYVLEINIRMGDPEAQILYPRLETDLLHIFEAIAFGRLNEVSLKWLDQASLGVYAVSGRYKGSRGWYKGYPERYGIGGEISGLDEVNALVFHGGTHWDPAIRGFRVRGGRVVCIVGLGDDIPSARKEVYHEIEKISFRGMRYRKDIGL